MKSFTSMSVFKDFPSDSIKIKSEVTMMTLSFQSAQIPQFKTFNRPLSWWFASSLFLSSYTIVASSLWSNDQLRWREQMWHSLFPFFFILLGLPSRGWWWFKVGELKKIHLVFSDLKAYFMVGKTEEWWVKRAWLESLLIKPKTFIISLTLIIKLWSVQKKNFVIIRLSKMCNSCFQYAWVPF